VLPKRDLKKEVVENGQKCDIPTRPAGQVKGERKGDSRIFIKKAGLREISLNLLSPAAF